ncbi:MAG: DnaJ domain-containing protein [Treponema sp.]|nr:DnaJ domain-containing protein [Treponema sp.]
MKFFNWIKDNIFFLLFCIIGSFAGIWGLLCGVMLGFFIQRLIDDKKEQKHLIDVLQNPFGYKEKLSKEPFDGALLMCAIAMNLSGTVSNTNRQIQAVFGKKIIFDWYFFCDAALKAKNKNNDLLTECLAAKLSQNKNTEILELVFTLFSALEFGWDFRIGNPPSVYLAELLNFSHISDELSNAYMILGVKKEDSAKTVKNAYRQLVRIYHPDVLKGLSNEQKKIASEAFLRIQKAYEKVSAAMGIKTNFSDA